MTQGMMERPDFPTRIREYLEERFKDEVHTPFEVHKGDVGWSSPDGKNLKWSVHTLTSLGCSSIEEDVDGKIWVKSSGIEVPSCFLTEDYGITDYEFVDKIIEELKDRSNWKKYEDIYKELIALFRWDDEISRVVSKKTGIEIAYVLSAEMPAEEDTHFCSVFDGKGMTDDQKMEEIKRRVEALILAYAMRRNIEAEREFWKKVGFRKRKRKHSGSRRKALE